MKLKIVSDGTRAGTKVVDADTGEVLEGVHMLSWGFSAGDQMADAMIAVEGVQVDIESTVDVVHIPRTAPAVLNIDVDLMNLMSGYATGGTDGAE